MAFIVKLFFWILIIYGCAIFLFGITVAALAEIQVLAGEFSSFGTAWYIQVAYLCEYAAQFGYYVTGNAGN